MRKMLLSDQVNYLQNERNIRRILASLDKYRFCKCDFFRIDVYDEMYSVVVTCLNVPFGGQVLKDEMNYEECNKFVEDNCRGLVESDYSGTGDF